MDTEKPKRIQLSRRKGWRKPAGAVVVARPTRWGNPFDVETFGRHLAVDLYRSMLDGFWSPSLLAEFDDQTVHRAYAEQQAWLRRLGGHPTEMAWPLKGLDVACWCPLDVECHGDALLAAVNPDLSFARHLSVGVGG